MKEIVDNLKKEKDVKVHSHKMSDTAEVKGFWSSFTELEIEVKDIGKLVDISFDYMPSSIEILEPERIEVDMKYMGDFINDLLARLHRYDMLIKNFYAENKLLKSRVRGKK
jgi:hypothetical protein